MAVAHSMVVSAFHMLSRHEPYRELGVNYVTVPDRPNPADVHRLILLILTHEEPLFVRCAVLVACRAEIYRIQSASFRTSGKETVT